MLREDRELLDGIIRRRGDGFWNDEPDSNREGLIEDLLEMIEAEGYTLALKKL